MDGVHDVGGMHGFGAVEREENEPPFHGSWEATVVAIMGAARSAGLFNLDEFRHAIERMDPAHYLGSTYFEHWLDGVTRLLIEKGVVSAADLDSASAQTRFDAGARPGEVAGSRTAAAARAVETSFRPSAAAPRFAIGASVVTRNMHPPGHTRLPRYARGKRGVITAHRGCHVFPDTNAHGLGEQPQHLYSLRFEARDLWGEVAEPAHGVYLDLWESYLLPA